MIGLLVVAQLAIIARGPDTASACAPIDVTVAARAAGNVAPRITPSPTTSSLQFLKSNLTTRIERDGSGRQTALTEGTFTFAADVPARVTLPTFTATVGSERASANAEPVNVHGAGTLPPTVLVRAWLDRGDSRGPVDTLYVGQQMDYVVDVHLNEAARQRLRRNPTFFPPEMPGVLAYDLAAPNAVTRTGHRCFETLSYRRALFPLFAGHSVIAPAALTYSLPLSTSFFSREESFELRTDSVRFTSVDAPTAGRPAGFGGAVGSLSVTSRLSDAEARMGDPVVLTLHVEGTGNVKLWPRPPLAISWGTLADGAERVSVDTTELRVHGSKEFDWLLTPRMSGKQDVPRIDYPYFNAEEERYGTTSAPPLQLNVATASLASLDSAPASHLAIRRSLREELPDPVSSRPWFWLVLAAAPLPVAFRRTRERHHSRRDTRTSAHRLRAAAAGSEQVTPSQLRRLFLGAVAERVPSVAGASRSADFARGLRRSGVSPDVADNASVFLEHLDAAAFSATGEVVPDAPARAAAIVDEIDKQAVPTTPARASRAGLAVLFIAVLATGASALPAALNQTFTAGVEAYDHAAFTSSQRLFSRVAARAPRAADAWANLGTAAWARGDSAAAVRGWQRALRLDPLDGESRDRLERVQPPVIRSPGYVPPIPVNALAIAALVAWVAAWLLLLLPRKYRAAGARAYAGGAMTVGVVLLLGALELHDRLDAGGLAVMRDTRLLLEAPGSTVAAASGVVGETGRIGAREGAWVRIALDNARSGWVPVASLLFMDAAPADD